MSSKKRKNKTRKVESLPDNLLPQNIAVVGQIGHQEKSVYILQSTYKEIHRFTKGKTEFESGGVLLGNVIEEFGKTNIIINGFVEAKYSEATPTTLTFTHESWDYIHKESSKRFPKSKIVGWIHTHPNFGIFLSDYDKFIHDNYYQDENQVAYVVDPIQKQEGIYCRINGRLELLTGFYLFDKIGVQITAAPDNPDKETASAERVAGSTLKNVVIGILVAAVLAVAVICVSLIGRLNALKQDYYSLVETNNSNVRIMTEQIQALTDELERIKEQSTKKESPDPSDIGAEKTPDYINAAP